jgi:membrane-associated phospholipid phosphatase
MKRDQFLLTSSIVQFALFLPLAWWARKHRVPPSDVAITRLLQRKQSSCARVGVKVLNTLTGSAVFMNVLVVPVAALLWRMHLRVEAVMMIVTCWMGGLVRSVIKQVVNRPRPDPLLVHVGTQTKGKSFPSGHVASSVCVWGWVFALGLLAKKKAQPGRNVLLGSTVMFVAFTGPARVYLGDHWATDVLGGYLFGGGWLSLSLYLYLRWRERGGMTKEAQLNKSTISASRGSSC